jgi:hypothetical protein
MFTSWFVIRINTTPIFLYRNRATYHRTFVYINPSKYNTVDNRKFNTSYEALLLNEYRTRNPS